MKYLIIILLVFNFGCNSEEGGSGSGGGGGSSSSSVSASSIPDFNLTTNTVSMLKFDSALTDETALHTYSNHASVISGSYIDFNGTNQWIDVPDSADWNFGAAAFTIEFYFRTSAAAGSDQYMFGKVDSSCGVNNNSINYAIKFIPADGRMSFNFKMSNLSSYTVDSDSSLNDNAWHHIAIVRSGDVFKMFVDGSLQTNSQTRSGALTTNAAKLALGRAGDCNGGYYDGQLDQVRISKSALYSSSFTPYSR